MKKKSSIQTHLSHCFVGNVRDRFSSISMSTKQLCVILSADGRSLSSLQINKRRVTLYLGFSLAGRQPSLTKICPPRQGSFKFHLLCRMVST